MTRMHMISRSHRPRVDAWKAWAAPWKLVVMVAGSSCRAIFSTAGHGVAQGRALLQVEGDGHRRGAAPYG